MTLTRRSKAEVQASDKEGAPPAFIVSAGYLAYGGVQVLYGNSINHLNLNLSGYDAIRVTFNGLEGGLKFNLVDHDNTGTANACGVNLPPPSAVLTSFTVDFPFSSYGSNKVETSPNWSDIWVLLFEFQAAGNLGVPNFAITGIEAIVESANPPATVVCPPGT
jgi:hypothetical protein